jgi:hypothetical protein
MKIIALMALVSFLVLSGMALASQSGEHKERTSMMEEMMKGGKEGEHKEGMMRMMKMMDQCASMMESMHSKADQKNESLEN